MDIAAAVSYVPVLPSGNRIAVNIPAASPVTYPDRTALRYLLNVYVQSFFQATTFDLATTTPADAAEAPPENANGVQVYRGADIEIQDLLEGYLSTCPPELNQTHISICEGLLRSYYTSYERLNGNVLINTATQTSAWVMKATLAYRDQKGWGNILFDNEAAKAGKFLTWKPVSNKIYPDQPEFLYFLNNLRPAPTCLKLRARVYFEDDSWQDLTIKQIDIVLPMTVYCCPVGPAALGLEALPKVVLKYEVWLSNQDTERISEVRYYTLSYAYRRQKRYVLFENSLGGFDTLAAVGSSSEKTTVQRQVSERFPALDFEPTYAERVIERIAGERELTINTGPRTKQERDYLEEILLSKALYVVTEKAHYPLLLTTAELAHHDEDETMIARTLVFRYANADAAASFLPAAPSLPTRPTGWRGHAEACEIDASTGLRTGQKRYGVLVQYYFDNNQDVEPYTQKLNFPQTPGYIAPFQSNDCAASTTPFRNVRIEKLGSFERNNCLTNQLGEKAMIVVLENTFGSNLSQEDAQNKAVQFSESLDTQSYANLFGACLNTPWVYTQAVATDSFFYRTNRPNSVGVWYVGLPYIGNTRNLANSTGANLYAPGTNNLEFPFQIQGLWSIQLYGEPFSAYTVKLYANGILIWQKNVTINNTGVHETQLVSGDVIPYAELPNPSRIYLLIENA
ncbi:MAG: hypothetical protein EAZ63_03805 [Runella slithyformis]|nr:MAG: hypothetical protein EAZ63_03805 [Runella slithyformis]